MSNRHNGNDTGDDTGGDSTGYHVVLDAIKRSGHSAIKLIRSAKSADLSELCGEGLHHELCRLGGALRVLSSDLVMFGE